MYKLIAIDLDGTLLNDEKIIPKENLETIKTLIDLGYEIVIATGRRYWSAKKLTKDIGRDMTILANNGSIVRQTKDDNTIATKYLKDYKRLIEAGKKRGLSSIVHVDDYYEGYDFIIEKDGLHKGYNNYISEDENRYRKIEDFSNMDEEKILAIVYAGNKKDMEDFYLELNQNYPGQYNSHVVGNIQLAEALLEILNLEACKWLSLLDYAKAKGIDSSEIIAIGDDNNDLQMIKESGCGIAMKNANDSVKKVADIITEKHNNQSGLAYELQKLLKIKVK